MDMETGPKASFDPALNQEQPLANRPNLGPSAAIAQPQVTSQRLCNVKPRLRNHPISLVRLFLQR